MCGWQPTATYMAAWSSSVARLAHNQEVVGSNPTVRNHYTQNQKDALGGRCEAASRQEDDKLLDVVRGGL